MKILISTLIIFLGAVAFSPVNAVEDKWTQYGKTDDGGFKFYINTTQIKSLGKGTFRIWEDDIAEPNRYKNNATGNFLMKQRWLKDINCPIKTVTVLQKTTFETNASPDIQRTPNPEAIFIEPDSENNNLLYNFLCKKDKK